MDQQDKVEALAKTKASAIQQKLAGDGAPSGAGYRVGLAEVDRIVADWPAAPKNIVQKTIERYGPPNVASPTLLTWYFNGPWKRTEISRDETVHNFPTPHTDYIANFIDYQVPVEKYEELGRFDGSVIPYRTRGEVSARCDNEAANFLSMNLMHDIVQGKRSVDEARKEFAEQTAAWAMDRPAPYTEKLHFPVPTAEQSGDPDEAIMKGAALHQAAEKIKDAFREGANG